MPRCLSKPYLRRLRNDIAIRALIADILEIPWKTTEGRFRFCCPLCHDFHTATNPRTNLARCFRCEQNFNPIDLTMIDKRYDFLQAVAFLDGYVHNSQPTVVVPSQPSSSLGRQ